MASITTLPTELLIDVFRAQSCIQDVHSLSSTSSTLRILWKHHAEHLMHYILQRRITCYPEAMALLMTQEEAKIHSDGGVLPAKTMASRQPGGCNRLRQIHRNHEVTARIYDALVNDVQAQQHPPWPTTEKESKRAICCFYYLQKMFLLEHEDHAVAVGLREDLQTMSIDKLKTLLSVMDRMAAFDEPKCQSKSANQLIMTALESEHYVRGMLRRDRADESRPRWRLILGTFHKRCHRSDKTCIAATCVACSNNFTLRTWLAHAQ